MKKNVIFIVLIIFFLKQIYSMQMCETIVDFEKVLDRIEKLHTEGKKNVWVVLDLDETVVRTVEPWLHFTHETILNETLKCYKNIFRDCRSINELKLQIVSQIEECITDPLIIQIIKNIKLYKFKALILTACGHGQGGRCRKKIEKVRFAHLDHVLNAANNVEKVLFGPFFMEYDFVPNFFNGQGNMPLFFKDMIFCGCISKGATFKELLKLFNKQSGSKCLPSDILFVDNFCKNVQDLCQVVEQVSIELDTKINFYGFEYTPWNTSPELDQGEMENQIMQFFHQNKQTSKSEDAPILQKTREQHHKKKSCCSVM